MGDGTDKGSVFTTIRDGVLFIDIDESVYSRDALLRTCYWFTDRAYIYITRPGLDHFVVQLRLKVTHPSLSNPNPERLEEIGGEFLNVLLDHQLRQDIETETGKIRELLVAKAFAEAGVLEDDPPGDPADSVESAQRSLTHLTVKG